MPAEHVTTKPTLADLLQGFADAPSIVIENISSDSRALKPGDLFLACGGDNSHGLDYIDDALAAGVAAIVWDSSTASRPDCDVGIPMVAVPGLAQHLGEIASRFYARPSSALRVIGITGTNGKTTVAWLIAQCCELLEQSCGYIGTLGYGVGSIDGAEGMTTPGAIELHAHLAVFRDAGAACAAIEVSSHALAQGRVDGIEFETVLFTNLSRDHLDYHGDMQRYADAKARLFQVSKAKHRIINLDSDFGTELAGRCGQAVVVVSTKVDRVANGRPFVFVRSVVAQTNGWRVTVSSSWGDGEFTLPLPGDFNVANAVIALAYFLQQGVPITTVCDALAFVSAPPGRMQRITAAEDLPAVYIDYAHTPEAVDLALRALKAHLKGRLWCVFGCGGDRDPGKRPQMGTLAERHADQLIITNDNPRYEDPASIVADIVAGLAKPEAATIIEDRAAAIAWAIREAAADDVVLIAGKGHENYQLLGDQRLNFSDYEVASANLARKAEANN